MKKRSDGDHELAKRVNVDFHLKVVQQKQNFARLAKVSQGNSLTKKPQARLTKNQVDVKVKITAIISQKKT